MQHGKVDIKKFGLLPKDKEALVKFEKGESPERKNILYLTQRKKYGTFELFMDTFCCCCKSKEDSFEEEDEKDVANDNIKIIDMMIFSEKNVLYQAFSIIVSFLCLFSSYFYLYVAAFRFSKDIVED
jgi:hypothetical protein